MPTSGPDGLAIELVAIGPLPAGLPEALLEPLARRFAAAVRAGPALPPPVDAFDAERGQYRADVLLDALVASFSGDAAWRLGLLDGDLYAPGLRFAFGQATVGGCCAVVGLTRLRPELHGGAPDPQLFLRRVLVEATHELGHVAGLDHCGDPGCVMAVSHEPRDTDGKGPGFCARCRLVSRPAPG